MRDFVLPRVLKFTPLLAISTLALVVIQSVYFAVMQQLPPLAPHPTIVNVFFNLLSLQVILDPLGPSLNTPAWYLSALVLCYIAFYLVLRYGRNARIKIALFVILAFTGSWQIVVSTAKESSFLFSSGIGRALQALFIGVLTAVLWALRKQTPRTKLRRNIVLYGEILWVVFFAWLLFRYPQFIGNPSVAFGLLIAPMLLLITLEWGPLIWLFNLKPFQWLARISLSIFLCHYPLGILVLALGAAGVHTWNYGSEVVFFGFLLVVLAVSWLSNIFIEQKLTKRILAIYYKFTD